MEPDNLLWEAVRTNDIETTRLLLGCICDRSKEESSLSECSPNPTAKTCRCKSVGVNKKQNGLSTVHLAIINNNMEILTLLFHHGGVLSPCSYSDVQSLDGDSIYFLEEFGPQLSALTLAVAFSDTTMVAFVFEKSPRFDPTALKLACKVCQMESVKILLKGMESVAQLSERDTLLMSPLLYAAKSNCNLDMVKLLLERGLDVTVKDALGNTPLHLATVSGSEPIVQLLIATLNQVRSSPCVVNDEEMSPFHLACRFGHCGILKQLLLHKCSLSCDPLARQNLLHEAAKYSQADVVTLLLQKGLSVNQFDSFAKTALFEAVKADNLHIVETLLRARADPNIPAAPYESPILYAAEHCSPQVIEALLRGGADVNTTDMVGVTSLIYAAKRAQRKCSRQEDITGLLLRYGADMTHKYLHTHTALSIAVACGNITCARVLIEAGATVTETPQSGKLALLHIAKTRECAELLLKYGVPVDHLNSADKTALMVACRDNNVEVASLLLEHSADVNKTTRDGVSALVYAICNDSALLVKDLIMAGAATFTDSLLIYFRSFLELALFLRGGQDVCRLLRLSGSTVRSSLPGLRVLCDSSNYLELVSSTVPHDLLHCKLWKRCANKRTCSVSDEFTMHSKMLSLEEMCCLMLRKYLRFNTQDMRSLCLPQHVISKLMLEIY